MALDILAGLLAAGLWVLVFNAGLWLLTLGREENNPPVAALGLILLVGNLLGGGWLVLDRVVL